MIFDTVKLISNHNQPRSLVYTLCVCVGVTILYFHNTVGF